MREDLGLGFKISATFEQLIAQCMTTMTRCGSSEPIEEQISEPVEEQSFGCDESDHSSSPNSLISNLERLLTAFLTNEQLS